MSALGTAWEHAGAGHAPQGSGPHAEAGEMVGWAGQEQGRATGDGVPELDAQAEERDLEHCGPPDRRLGALGSADVPAPQSGVLGMSDKEQVRTAMITISARYLTAGLTAPGWRPTSSTSCYHSSTSARPRTSHA